METKEERAERKANFISYVLSKSFGVEDEEKLIKEAEEMFEKANPPAQE